MTTVVRGLGRWRLLGFVARILLVVLAAALAIIQGLMEAEIFTEPAWLPVVLVLAIALLTMVDNARGAWRMYSAPKREGAHIRMQKATISALRQVSQLRSLDLAVIGGSIFVVRRRVTFRRSVLFLRRRRPQSLSRTLRFRLNDYPQASTVRWTRGKGAIGEVLRTRRPCHVYWAPIAKRYGKQISRERFDRLPSQTRAGFTYEEFIGIAWKYAEVLAVPIMSEDGGRMLGVLAIDRPFKASDNGAPLFDDDEVRSTLEEAAVAIRDDL